MMLTFANGIWGARCGKSARRVLLGETRSSGHAYSVRGARESAALRQAPQGLPSSRLVPTILEGFLAGLDLHDVTLCGVSIGGAISLILPGRRNARVARVIAINPYDYAKGRGMTRSSLLGWMITVTSETPMIGGTVMRLRNFAIMKAVLQGGVVNPRSIRPALLKEMYVVGNRHGHYRAFINLLRHAASWEAATKVYGNINVPVCLIWGDKDWSKPSEREHDRSIIPGVQMTTVEDGGHFLPLDRPQELRE